MKKILIHLQVLIFLFGIIFSGYSQESEIQVPDDLNAELPTDPEVISGVLPNGIKYYIRHNEEPKNRAELRLVTDAGSVLEDDDQLGIAHLCEHMAFNGTKNFPKHQLINFLESIGMKFGAELNAYTSFDETVYFLQIPTENKAFIDTGFMILSDWAHNVMFEDEEIDKERGVVVEEWRLGRGAQDRMMRKYFPVMFKNSRYAERMVIGDTNILLHTPHEAIKRFYKDWYRPDLQAVIAVGDFNVDTIKMMIEKYFSAIPPRENPRERIYYPVPDHDEILVSVVSDKENPYSQLLYIIKKDIKEEKTHGDYRQNIIEEMFMSMLSDRLSEKLQEENPPFMFAAAQSARIIRTKDAFLMIAIPKNNQVENSLKILMDEIQRIKLYGFTKTELERKKIEFLREFENMYKERDKIRTTDLASEYQRNFLQSEPYPGIAYELAMYKKFLPTISLDEVNGLIDNIITNKNNVIVVTLPEKEGVKEVKEKTLLKIVNKSRKNKKLEPYVDKFSNKPLIEELPEPGTIVETKELEKVGAQEWTLSNGVKVILKPTDFKNDEIIMRAFSYGGYSLYDLKDDISARYADEVISRSGIGDFDNIELEKKLAGKIVSVYPYIGELEEGLNGNSSVDDLETLFQLIHLYFTSPRKDLKAFGNFISEQKNSLENRSLSPTSAFSDTITTTVYQYHPRKMPLKPEDFDKANLDRMIEIYKERFKNASDFTFVFVGSFTYEQMKPLVLKYLGSLPADGNSETFKNLGVKYPDKKIEKYVYRGMEAKSMVYLRFNGVKDYHFDPVTNLQLRAAIDVLNIRLRENIREEKSGVYSISARLSTSKYPEENYSLTIFFGCDPDRVDELVSAVIEEIKKLETEGTNEINLKKVKETLLRSREVNLRKNNFWLRTLYSNLFNNMNFELLDDYENKVNSITNETIKEVTARYIDPDNYVKIVLYPESKKP